MTATCAALLLLPPAFQAAHAQQASTAGAESLVQQANAARDANNLPQALALYHQAVQLDPQYADAWWFLGFLSYGADDYATARDALTHFIDLKPPAAPALALRGLSEFELHDYAASLPDIEKGIALGAANQPRNEQLLRMHEGLLLTRAGQFERALQTYLLLANEGVTTPALTLGLGLAGLRIAALPQDVPAPQQDLAFAAGQAALQLVAASRPSAEVSADAAPSTADAAFTALSERYPDAPGIHYLHGYLLFASDPEKAVAQFQQELKADHPGTLQSAPAHAMLAWAALMRSDAHAALAPASDAVSADPALPLGQLVLGRALLETGSTAAGTQHLERARQLEPDNLETHLALARAYSTSNHPEEARRERLLCLRLTEDHASAP